MKMGWKRWLISLTIDSRANSAILNSLANLWSSVLPEFHCPMHFVASLTRDPTEIRRLARLWRESGDTRNPFRHVLVSAIFTKPNTLSLIRQMKEDGLIEQVTFDSGGFFVQMGKITYEEMYWRLLQFYREHSWADWYTLPDYMPLSTDDEATSWYKTRRSANGSRRFFEEMPSSQQSRALPVIQGRTEEQIEYCLKTFLPLDVQRFGFGSFGTNGKESSANLLTTESLEFVSYIAKVLQEQQKSLHAFGVGTPPIVYLLHCAGVSSFDSIGWMKTAGFGKVYLPFIRAYNITYDDTGARGMKQATFEELKHLSQHRCAFCESFDMLSKKREYRVLHNLAAIHDTVEMVLTGNAANMLHLTDKYAPAYTRLRRTITDNGN